MDYTFVQTDDAYQQWLWFVLWLVTWQAGNMYNPCHLLPEQQVMGVDAQGACNRMPRVRPCLMFQQRDRLAATTQMLLAAYRTADIGLVQHAVSCGLQQRRRWSRQIKAVAMSKCQKHAQCFCHKAELGLLIYLLNSLKRLQAVLRLTPVYMTFALAGDTAGVLVRKHPHDGCKGIPHISWHHDTSILGTRGKL